MNAPGDSALHLGRQQLLAGACVLLALAVPTLLAHSVDDRLLAGASVWDKPLKFDLSLGLHLLTLWAVAGLVDHRAQRAVAVLRRAIVACTVCALGEGLYITLQAARGRASHFSRDTSTESLLYYGAMGPAALAILVATFVIGLIVWRHARASVAAGLHRGAALGLMLGSVLTLVAVVPLSAGFVDGLGHWVGGARSDAHGLPFVGWATRGGDLRVPHFFATHLMQGLPLAGWLLDRLAPTRAAAAVNALAVLGAAVVAFTLWQACTGQPFLRMR